MNETGKGSNRLAWFGLAVLCLALLIGPTLLSHLETWYDRP